MSRYLIERIEATPNIELIFNAEVVGLEGDEDASLRARALAQPAGAGRCAQPRYPQSVSVRRRRSGDRLARRLRREGRPRAASCVTGAQCEQNDGRPVPPLETSVPGVFAVGDVRSGSVKRVGGAIGEGAQVVAALHGFLADAMKPSL